MSLPYAYGLDLERCSWSSGHARLLGLMPITSAERAFNVEHGVDALDQRFEDAAINFTDPNRASVA